jgi:two-component system NtrC family sensor kinase
MPWLESIPVAALRCDASGTILAANRLAAVQFGCVREQLVGRAWSELGGGGASNGNGNGAGAATEVPLADGRLLLFTSHDPLQQLKQQIYHLSRLASAGRLVSVVVHEINNALSGILGYAQLLTTHALPPEARRDLERIHDEALRTARIAQNLLKFSRTGIGERTRFPIGDLLRHCAELKRRDFALRSVELKLDVQDDLPALWGDETLVTQVFVNLLTNAQQSIASVRERGLVRVTASLADGVVQVDVEDDGPGIPERLRDRVFEPFFTSRSDGTGTGLGLTLCREILREHGGAITIEHGKLPGACLRLVFPPAAEPAPARVQPCAAARRAPAPAPLQRCRIVVVEDEPAQREVVTRAFAGHGNRTVVFEHGEDALPYLLSEPVDLVVSDIRRPGLNGIELHDSLARMRPALLKRLLFVTGDVLSPETTAFLARSRARFLRKPLRLDELLDVAKALVERASNQGELFEAAT